MIAGMVVGVPHAIDGLGASPTLPEIVLDVLGDREAERPADVLA
jgi:muramoyltetrapeptide carboxypeptidase